jgi:hypothetical protein
MAKHLAMPFFLRFMFGIAAGLIVFIMLLALFQVAILEWGHLIGVGM